MNKATFLKLEEKMAMQGKRVLGYLSDDVLFPENLQTIIPEGAIERVMSDVFIKPIKSTQMMNLRVLVYDTLRKLEMDKKYKYFNYTLIALPFVLMNLALMASIFKQENKARRVFIRKEVKFFIENGFEPEEILRALEEFNDRTEAEKVAIDSKSRVFVERIRNLLEFIDTQDVTEEGENNE